MSDIEDSLDLFAEPEDFRPPPPEPTFQSYRRQDLAADPAEIKLRLVGNSPLWGHLLWNASIVTANYIDTHREDLITNKRVLELGAAAGLPSLVAALSASHVVVTDYPDLDLLENLNYNAALLKEQTQKELPISVIGHIWGYDATELLTTPSPTNGSTGKFDFIILSDLIFNHSQHDNMLKTCDACLAEGGTILVVFTHHRPWLADKDLEMFERAEKFGFKSTKLPDIKMDPMFAKDPGSVDVRSTVNTYILTRQ
ncbi:protein N-terminal and lysine N-methyltransferase EFM7 [Trichomonascus vanleenenianus]|uniref:S-adenosylmethionine-dependent methyltransferase n=1 Tax=Trichomonascus vanleenenianus TaxID=2268995 RepID=UPI003ECB9AD5